MEVDLAEAEVLFEVDGAAVGRVAPSRLQSCRRKLSSASPLEVEDEDVVEVVVLSAEVVVVVLGVPPRVPAADMTANMKASLALSGSAAALAAREAIAAMAWGACGGLRGRGRSYGG